MAAVRKKQDDKNLKILREIVSAGGNKQCFDCEQKGPTYVNMTIGSFVCTRCSGLLRGINPPHRIKSISMATFTNDELEFLKTNGNDACAKTWLGLWDPKREQKLEPRQLMIDKYERKRWYLEPASPLKSLSTASQLTGCKTGTQPSSEPTQLRNDTIRWVSPPPKQPPSSHRNGIKNISNGTNNLPAYPKLLAKEDVKTLQHLRLYNSQAGYRKQLQKEQSDLIGNNGALNGVNNKTNDNGNNNNSNLNAFTQDTEFIADFGSINIFNNNNLKTGNQLIDNGIPVNGNGNRNGTPTVNGNNNIIKMPGPLNGGVNDKINANMENFADFEHNQIYNAAAENQHTVDLFPPPLHNHINQWNGWQQFTSWPFVHPEQTNRWSLPMSLSPTTNSLNSNGTFHSSSSLSSTPSADRYAALKDLDEQLREGKDQPPVPSMVQSQTTMTTANPFKVIPATVPNNPFQASDGFVDSNSGHNNWMATMAGPVEHPIHTQNGGGQFSVQPKSNFTQPSAEGFATFNGFGAGFKNPFSTTPVGTNNPFL